MKKRLHLVVEGHGDVSAGPNLVARVLAHLGRSGWFVNSPASRLPRAQLVNESAPSPNRPPLSNGLDRALGMAKAARADALVVLVDSDDDCPAAFGPPARLRLEAQMPSAAVMAVREFETWLVLSRPLAELARAGIRDAERKRDGKRMLERLVPGYLPTRDQGELARLIDVEELRRRSRSFEKLVRDVERLTE